LPFDNLPQRLCSSSTLVTLTASQIQEPSTCLSHTIATSYYHQSATASHCLLSHIIQRDPLYPVSLFLPSDPATLILTMAFGSLLLTYWHCQWLRDTHTVCKESEVKCNCEQHW